MLGYRKFMQFITEELITVGGKAYPHFGNVVIMAGGAGSGKGFVLKHLLGMEGFVFDVDALKTVVMRTPVLIKKIQDEFGVDVSHGKFSLKDPENVSKLHMIIADSLGIDNKRLQALYTSIFSSDPERKPNIIFDVTLKDLRKLENLSTSAKMLGYDTKKIHIVWVINDIEVAIAQNEKRSRTVPQEILVNTHRGVSQTMRDIVGMGDSLARYMDGDIIFAFNNGKVDTEINTSKAGGKYVIKSNYFRIKRAGHPVMSVENIKKEFGAKIASYVPKDASWEH